MDDGLAFARVDSRDGSVNVMSSPEQSVVATQSGKVQSILSAGDGARVDLLEAAATSWLTPRFGLAVNRNGGSAVFPLPLDQVEVPE